MEIREIPWLKKEFHHGRARIETETVLFINNAGEKLDNSVKIRETPWLKKEFHHGRARIITDR